MLDSNSIYKDTEQKMQKVSENLIKELSKIRTDRAHPNLLEDLTVEYYGQRTIISRVATILAEDARTLTISPFDKNTLPSINQAIIAANLGLNPVVSGTIIRVPIPPLTEERRKALVKQIKSETENARVSVRNIRRDANNHVKSLVKNNTTSLNEKESTENKIQKLTDQYIDKIDKIGVTKENDIMKV